MSSIVMQVILVGGSVEMPLDDPVVPLAKIKPFVNPEVVVGNEFPFVEPEDIPENSSARLKPCDLLRAFKLRGYF